MLAIYSITGKKKSQTVFLFIFALLVFSLAFPTPLQDLFINLHIPVLSTSAASRIIVLYSFLFAVLSAFGLDQLILDIKNRKFRKIFTWLLSFGFLFFALWAVVYLKLFIPDERIIVAKSNLILPTIIFAASVFIILLANFNKRLLPIFIYTLLLLVSFDMLRFAIKWMPFDPKDLVFPDTSTTKSFSKISGYNRVFGNLGGEAWIYYHLPSVEGYDALYIKKYGESISFIENGIPSDLRRSVVLFPKNGKHTSSAINLLNIKYIVHKLADDHAGWTFPYWEYANDQFKLVYKDSMYEFYENMNVFPHVFLAGKYKVEKDSGKILNLMFDNNFDLRKEIVLEEDPKMDQANEDLGSAKITSYKSNSIEISVEAKENALLFVSENYYPGWKASVNGKNTPILRANYAFRAISVEKGQYAVRFFYDPWSFRLGFYLAIGGLVGIILLMILISRKANRSKPSSF